MTLALTPEPGDRQALRKSVRLLLTILGGGIGTLGGPVGAALAAGGTEVLNQVVDGLRTRARQRSTDNAQTVIHVAINRTGLSTTDLAAALTADPAVCQLAVVALETAAETTVEDKTRLMGHVLANAAIDSACVDEEMLLTRAVGLLDAPHFRVLALLDDPPRFDASSTDSSTIRWTPQHLAVRLGWPQRSVTSVLLTLQGVAAAFLAPSVVDGGSSTTYRELMQTRRPHELDDMYCEITDFGAHLAARVRAAAREK